MPVVLFTPAAKSDIDKIWNYTVANWGEIQAITYIHEITTTCDEIAEENTLATQQKIFELATKSYINAHVVFFKTNSSGNIEVIPILHQ